MVIWICFGLVWLAGGIASYRLLLPQVLADGDSKFTGFVANMMFWWIVLPVVTVVWSLKAGGYYFGKFKASRETKVLRAGAENGLYDPVEYRGSQP